MLVVLRAGDAVPNVAERRGDFFRLIREGVGEAWGAAWREIDIRDEATPLPDPSDASGFIVTGSASSVTERAPWMLRTEAWLREATASNVPILGICFGHQMLAQALGGRVTKNPRGREIGTVTVRLEPRAKADPLFGGLPDEIHANATHVDSVAEPPKDAELLATTSLDDFAAFRVKRAWGVQFHPEIDGDVMRVYLTTRRTLIEGEGLPWDEMFASVKDAPYAMGVMRAFARAIGR